MGTNGAFTYTPPANYVGLDSFIYTASNGTGNDQATVLLRVLPDIYVRLQQVDTQYESITQTCPPPPAFGNQQDGGDLQRGLFRLFFYSNSAGTTPMDVTGLNLQVNIKVTGTYYTGGGYNYTYPESPAGTTYDLYSGSFYEYYHYEYDCFGNVVYYTNESLTVAPGNYTII
jgi:hypothetical protein